MSTLFNYLKSKNWYRGLTKDIHIQRSIALMLAFPAMIIIWAVIFEHRGNNIKPWSDFIVYFPLIIMACFFVYGFYYIHKNKGYRIATIIFFIINIYFTLVTSLAAIMVISGNFL